MLNNPLASLASVTSSGASQVNTPAMGPWMGNQSRNDVQPFYPMKTQILLDFKHQKSWFYGYQSGLKHQ